MVPSVTIAYHIASGMVPNLSGCALRSARCIMPAAKSVAPSRITKTAEQRPALSVEGIQQRAHRRRIARQLEKADHAKHQQDAQVGRHSKSKPKRQDGEQIDKSERTTHKFPAGHQRAQVPIWWVFNGDPHAKPVFDRECDERQQFDASEQRHMLGGQGGHRLDRDGDQIDHDEEGYEPPDNRARSVPDPAVVQNLVQPATQGRGRRRTHVGHMFGVPRRLDAWAPSGSR